MMATGKAIVDGARSETKGTVVTTMTRNGVNFGIRIAETEDGMAHCPGQYAKRSVLYRLLLKQTVSLDYRRQRHYGNPVGVGAMAMVAAPGVTRFVAVPAVLKMPCGNIE